MYRPAQLSKYPRLIIQRSEINATLVILVVHQVLVAEPRPWVPPVKLEKRESQISHQT